MRRLAYEHRQSEESAACKYHVTHTDCALLASCRGAELCCSFHVFCQFFPFSTLGAHLTDGGGFPRPSSALFKFDDGVGVVRWRGRQRGGMWRRWRRGEQFCHISDADGQHGKLHARRVRHSIKLRTMSPSFFPGVATGTNALTSDEYCAQILGAGVVGLPYAFYHAGAWLSVVCMVVATLMASATMGYIFETSAWASLYLSTTSSSAVSDDATAQRREPSVEEEGGEGDRGGSEGDNVGDVGVEEIAGPGRDAERERIGWPGWEVERRAFEISELCGIFLGRRARRAFEVCLFCYTMGTCWLFATIFASSLALVVPLPLPHQPVSLSWCLTNCEARDSASCLSETGACEWAAGNNTAANASALAARAPSWADAGAASGGRCVPDAQVLSYCECSYHVFLAFFALAMGVCVSLDVSKLHWLQLGISALAVSSLSAMILTCVLATLDDRDPDDTPFDSLPATDIRGLGKIVTAALFGQLCHQGVPTVVALMRHREHAKNVFRVSLGVTLGIYLALCFATNVYFGPRVLPIITLDWQDYTGGARVGMPISWWARVISLSVITFPVMTVSAAFPLCIFPLSQTVYKALVPRLRPRLGSAAAAASDALAARNAAAAGASGAAQRWWRGFTAIV